MTFEVLINFQAWKTMLIFPGDHGNPVYYTGNYITLCIYVSSWRSLLTVGDLDRSALEQECRGMFVDLRKAFFMIPGPESPLAAKVCTSGYEMISQASAL